MNERALIALIDRQTLARERIDTNLERMILRLWRQVNSPYDVRQTDQFIEQVVTFVRAGQTQVASMTEAYLTQALRTIANRDDVELFGVRSEYARGVPAEEVYQRSFMTWRYLNSVGKEDIAASEALTRTLTAADTDLALSVRDAEQQFMQQHHVNKWFRVTRPELSKSGSCGLCKLASQRTYYREDLKEIHHKCKCTVLPDAGNIDLDAINDSSSVEPISFTVKQHGELGPILVPQGQHFRTEHQADADRN